MNVFGKTFILGTLWNHPSAASIAAGLQARGATLLKKEEVIAQAKASMEALRTLKIGGIILPSAEKTQDNEWMAAFFHCPIYNELDLAQQLSTTPIVAITGTNGKTSTTEMIALCLKASQRKVGLFYNFEKSILEIEPADFAVTECWSAQLETSKTFRPKISVLLNIEPDHIEQHGSLAHYIATKKQIFVNQRKSDILIYNADCPLTRKLVLKFAPKSLRRIAFSCKQPPITIGECIFLKKDLVFYRKGKRTKQMGSFADLPFFGSHMHLNRLAVLGVGVALNLNIEKFFEVFSEYKLQPHRQEILATNQPFVFVDDAISSGFHSARIALQRFMVDKWLHHKPLVWLTGGRDKQFPQKAISDFVLWFAKRQKKCVPKVTIILLGHFPSLEKEFKRRRISFLKVATMNEAVTKAATVLRKRGTLLFSPVGAADDLFNEYDDRGQAFQQVVRLIFK